MNTDKKSRKTIAIDAELHKRMKKEAAETDSGIQKVADKYIEMGFQYSEESKAKKQAGQAIDAAREINNELKN